MSLVSWLRKPKQSDAAKRMRTPASPRKRSTFRPQLEALEDRWMPSSILTVMNNDDHGGGSLRDEIAHAKTNDVIVFSPMLDGETIALTSGELDITKNLTIQGPGAGQLTISGRKSLSYEGSRVFEVAQNTTVTLIGLTITNGNAHANDLFGFGGGILNQGTLTVSGCTISGNFANNFGGGIDNTGTLTVTGCTISGNQADFDGGGIYNAGTLTVSGCTISGNSAYFDGSGIYNAGMLTVSNSVFNGNYIFGTYTDGGGNTFS